MAIRASQSCAWGTELGRILGQLCGGVNMLAPLILQVVPIPYHIHACTHCMLARSLLSSHDAPNRLPTFQWASTVASASVQAQMRGTVHLHQPKKNGLDLHPTTPACVCTCRTTMSLFFNITSPLCHIITPTLVAPAHMPPGPESGSCPRQSATSQRNGPCLGASGAPLDALLDCCALPAPPLIVGCVHMQAASASVPAAEQVGWLAVCLSWGQGLIRGLWRLELYCWDVGCPGRTCNLWHHCCHCSLCEGLHHPRIRCLKASWPQSRSHQS